MSTHIYHRDAETQRVSEAAQSWWFSLQIKGFMNIPEIGSK